MEEEEKDLEVTESNRDADTPSGASGESWWSSWGKEWIVSVKEKSASTIEMVKKDLNEFVDVIQGDTSVAISDTADKMEESVKQNESNDEPQDSAKKVLKQSVEGFSKFLHSVSELMAIEPDDTQEEFITLSDDKFSTQGYDRKQEKLHIIQTDPGTYCNEPEGLIDDWLKVFTLDDHKTEMSDLLVQNSAVRAIYTQLVPNVVSHTTFWQRYFYQIFLLEAEERRRTELLARAIETNSKDDEVDEGWGNEDDEIEVVPTSSSAITVIHVEDKSDIDEPDNKEILQPDNEKNSVMITKAEKDSPSMLLDGTENKESTTAEVNTNPEKASELVEKISVLKTSEAESNEIIEAPNKSYDTIGTSKDFIKEDSEYSSTSNSPETQMKSADNSRLQLLQHESNSKLEYSETSSLSSWISIDDDIKVKKIKGEMKVGSPENSEGKSSRGSSGVMVNKSDADDLDDDDFDLELDDDDVNAEELAKLVEDIKNKSAAGTLQDEDDDDWENWE